MIDLKQIRIPVVLEARSLDMRLRLAKQMLADMEAREAYWGKRGWQWRLKLPIDFRWMLDPRYSVIDVLVFAILIAVIKLFSV